jgi:hypothetical protein
MVVNDSSHFCLCPINNCKFIRDYLPTDLAVYILGIASNLLTILVLMRIQKKSSSENLLLAIAMADLILPSTLLARHFTASIGMKEISFIITLVYYLWPVTQIISISLTLVLAARRYIAIEHVNVYQRLRVHSRQRTKKIILAICIYSVVLPLPILFYTFDPKSADGIYKPCEIKLAKKIVYTSIIMATTHLRQYYMLKIAHWIYVFVFLLASPVFLCVLSFK